MTYEGPCYLCGKTIGEYETREYVRGRGKAHPACQSMIAGTDVTVNVDEPWGASFPDGKTEIVNGLSIRYKRGEIGDITVDSPIETPVTRAPNVINGESSRRIRVRKGQTPGKTEFTGEYEILGDAELSQSESAEAERQIAQADSEHASNRGVAVPKPAKRSHKRKPAG